MNNIIIVQEIIHSMNNIKGKKGFMAIKADLEKAYDRVNWQFLWDSLEEIGLERRLIEVIWHCISSPTTKILWNERKIESFAISKGVRQEDPLSPYLFVIYIGRLAHFIQYAVDQNYWKPFGLCRIEPKFSHLFFSNDLFIFAEGSLDQVKVILKSFDIFCDCTE